MRTFFLSALLAVSSLFAVVPAYAEPVAGEQYDVLKKPVPVSDPGKIEVVSLFWYGCPHCYQLEPFLHEWAEKLPDDVNFIRVPAMFGNVWNIHGQLFITLETMKVDYQVHEAVFKAVNERKRLISEDEMTSFLADYGVDRQEFLKMFNSFTVKSRMEKAKKLAIAYQITGVPAMVVNGKYRFDISSAGGIPQTLELADYLIAKERAAQ